MWSIKMHMQTRLVLAFILLCAVAGTETLPAQGIEFLHDKKLQEVLDMAKAQNKLIFMDCYTSWCGPCKRLAATVFPDSTVGAFFNANFINAKFDMEKDDGVNVANKYSVRAYPTLLWIDGNGAVKHQEVGGLDPTDLIMHGKKAIDTTPELLAHMRKEYSDGYRDANFLGDYAHVLYLSEEKYQDVFKEYLDKLSKGDFTDAKHGRIIFDLTDDIKSPGLDYIVKNRDYYMHLVSPNIYYNKINEIATHAVSNASRNSDKAQFNDAINLVKSNKAPDRDEKTLKLSMDYYSSTAQWENYDKCASQYIKKYGAKNAALLNDVAWDYYINVHSNEQLQKAKKWAYQALNIDNKYTYNLTYAYLLYKLNDYKEAQKACDYAIIRAKAENVTPTSANGLKDAIQKTLPKAQ